jgi:hypothetical protein
VVTEPLRIRVTYPLPGNGQAGTYISRRCPGIHNLRNQLLPRLRNRCLVINNSSLLVSANMSHVPVARQGPGWNIHIFSYISALWAECHISPCVYSSLYSQVREGNETLCYDMSNPFQSPAFPELSCLNLSRRWRCRILIKSWFNFNYIYLRQHNFCTDTPFVFRPFGHHEICTFNVGCTANPLHWPMFTAGIFCIVGLIYFRTRSLKSLSSENRLNSELLLLETFSSFCRYFTLDYYGVL